MIFSEDTNVYYVYAYLRKSDLTPYYIGKGHGSRAFAKSHNVKVPEDRRRVVFVETNLTNIGACALERRLIQWYGRKDINTGILRNLTDGGDRGTAGMKHKSSTKKQMSLSATGKTMPQSAVDASAAAKRGKSLTHSGSFVTGQTPWNKRYGLIVTTPLGETTQYETVNEYANASGHKPRNIYYLANVYRNTVVLRGKFKGYVFCLDES